MGLNTYKPIHVVIRTLSPLVHALICTRVDFGTRSTLIHVSPKSRSRSRGSKKVRQFATGGRGQDYVTLLFNFCYHTYETWNWKWCL